MKPLPITLLLLVLGIGMVTCKKSGDKKTNPTNPTIDIKGFTLTDYNGNLIGYNGTKDSDWMIRPQLSAQEMALFQFDTHLSLTNTKQVSFSSPAVVEAFPNPAWLQQGVNFYPSDSNVVKLVVADSMLRVVVDTAVKVKGGSDIYFNLRDTTLFPNHSSRRIYFSFSADGHPDYAVGYGDIRICNGNSVNDCF